MAEVTTGTVNATPLGDFWIGTLELPASTDDADTANLDRFLQGNKKVKHVIFAAGVSDATGTVNYQPIKITPGTAAITLNNSGGLTGTASYDQGQVSVSNKRRDIFFIARSQQP